MRNQTQIIATCNKKGEITGEIERWEAHKKGILHRAFTVALIYKGKYVIQHRKHPVFDGMLDVTSSSHQIIKDGKLEDTIEASRKCILREWKLGKNDLGKFKITGAVYYKAKDEKSIYIEHEYCDVVEVAVKKFPEPNFEVAYGALLMSKEELMDKKSRFYSLLTPWVKRMIENNKL